MQWQQRLFLRARISVRLPSRDGQGPNPLGLRAGPSEGRVFRMPVAHRRRPPHGLQPIAVRQSGEEVTRLMGEDRQPIPDTCFLTPFEVDKGLDPALPPLPEVYDRHRRRLKQGARF